MEIKIIGTSSELATFLSELANNQRDVLDKIKLTTEQLEEKSTKKKAARPKGSTNKTKTVGKKTKGTGKKTRKNSEEQKNELKVIDKNTAYLGDVLYVSANQLSKKLCVSTTAIYYYKKTGKVDFIQVDKNIYFNSNDFDKLSAKIQNNGKKVRMGRYDKCVEKSPYAKWKFDLHALCKKSSRDEGTILSEAYKKLTNVYGVVYDQLRKDFYRVNGYSSQSTLEMVYWLETNDKNYKGLLEAVVHDIVANEKVE